MGSSSLLDQYGDVVSQSGRSSRHHAKSSRHKKRRSHSHSPSRSRSRSRDRSRDRNRDRSRSRNRDRGIFGGESGHRRHSSSKGSFFGLGGNNSRSSLFGSSRPSYYKRSPREGFVQRCIKQLKRLLRDLQHYAKRHPWKVFFLVILPLVTGGALTALLARFGLRIPPSLERMLGVAKRAATGDPFSAVGDAVRMAGEYGNGNPNASGNAIANAAGHSYANAAGHSYANAAGNSYARGSRVERGRSGDLQWERKASYYDDGGQEGGMMDGFRKGVSKFFS
ncbi:uncharacterized protein Triagg1_3055 [Trichoderma aggressivum f. europaeum]|uniref:Uncharacterized protein n=1 Tax=Trichoderma aggressivum f. europaeum TaxID=173218 RepID=A0AAE1IG55_9HYPO|nr:hypothetical protein Triagg1_3055 [Trichoderma aggressivum f. europaeum]